MSAVVTSAGPFVTDERLAAFAPWAPILIAALMVLAYLWIDFGKPLVGDAEEESSTMPDWAPPTAPELAPLEDRLRTADHG